MVDLLERRSRFLDVLRRFFKDRHYLEVETPILSPYLIPEPSLEVFRTEVLTLEGKSRSAYLIPSPELWMKRLLVEGTGNLFQITKSFRNLEFAGRQHNPEFTLLEWYSLDHDYMDEITVIEDLLKAIGSIEGSQIIPLPLKRITVAQALYKALDLDLDGLMERQAMNDAARRIGHKVDEDDSWEESFQKLFVANVEPVIESMGSVVVTDYPKNVPTLARSEGAYSERWELYVDGTEIANCFTEEGCSDNLRGLFRLEERRKGRCRVPHPTDWGLINAIDKGLPPCAGVALGIDRLFMVLWDIKSIHQVLPFPFSEIFL